MHNAPITPTASGRNMSAPAPTPYASGTRPRTSRSARSSAPAADRPPAGLHQRLDQRQPAATEVIDVVEHQDAVLRDDPDADDRAEERDDVQGESPSATGRRPRQPAPSTAAADDRQWMQDGAELQQQHAVDQQNAHDQHDQQVAERLLLLLKQPAVLDRDAGGNF